MEQRSETASTRRSTKTPAMCRSSVSFFEQTARASACQTFQRLGVTQVRVPCQDVAYIAAGCQAFHIGNNFVARIPHCCPR